MLNKNIYIHSWGGAVQTKPILNPSIFLSSQYLPEYPIYLELKIYF